MTFEVVSILCGGRGFTAPGEFTYRQLDNRCNYYSPAQLYQQALETSESDIICYAHDDLTIHDPNWVTEVLFPFNPFPFNPKGDVVAVGLGGVPRLANKDLYRKPFNIWNMARSGYCSNQDDAETHGERFNGVRRVAVLDAFFMAVQRDFLVAVGGWPVQFLTHHCLDLWLACIAARYQRESWMVGLPCIHAGGGSSIKEGYKKAKWLQGGSIEMDHLIPHIWLADSYRDTLPIEVE